MTTEKVREALRLRFQAPAWALLEEVRSHTGYSRGGRERYADAIAMSLWPSRGIEIHGIEIKVSRADWLRERDDPEKAERIAAYCDRWWLAVKSADIVKDGELPPAWGLLILNGKKLESAHDAARNPDPRPIDRRWLASLLRRVAESNQRILAEYIPRASLAEETDRQVAAELERHTARAVAAARREEAARATAHLFAATWAERVATESGLTIGEPWPHGRLRELLGAMKHRTDADALRHQLRAQAEQLQRAASVLAAGADQLDGKIRGAS